MTGRGFGSWRGCGGRLCGVAKSVGGECRVGRCPNEDACRAGRGFPRQRAATLRFPFPARGRGRKGRGRTHHENAAYSRLPPETMFAESPPHVPMGAIRAKTNDGRERSDPRSGHGSASGMTGRDAGLAGCPCPTLAPAGGKGREAPSVYSRTAAKAEPGSTRRRSRGARRDRNCPFIKQ